MADKTISELPAAPSQLNLYDGTELFVLQQANEAKKLQMQILENWLVSIADGHGGIQRIELTGSTTTDPVVDTYTITYADLTTSTFTVTNGARGPQGEAMYLYVRYADTGANPPSQDSDMSIVPGPWVGVCASTSSDPSTLHVGDFTWFSWQGPAGTPITEVVRTSGDGSPGTTDTYTVYAGSAVVGTFLVYNGLNGTGSVNQVCGVNPDAGGNVILVPADVGAPAIPLHLTATITSLPATLSNTAITADMRVIECTFGTPSAIRSDVSWTTAAGSIVLSGTMSGSTTVDLILIETT